MEYSNLEKDNKIQNILQKTINEVDTNASYSQNYEYFLRICAAIRKLKTIEPSSVFKVSKTPTTSKNYFSKKEKKK